MTTNATNNGTTTANAVPQAARDHLLSAAKSVIWKLNRKVNTLKPDVFAWAEISIQDTTVRELMQAIERVEEIGQGDDSPTHTSELEDMTLELLCHALPFIEEAEKDEAYKPGTVRAFAQQIRGHLEKVDAADKAAKAVEKSCEAIPTGGHAMTAEDCDGQHSGIIGTYDPSTGKRKPEVAIQFCLISYVGLTRSHAPILEMMTPSEAGTRNELLARAVGEQMADKIKWAYMGL